MTVPKHQILVLLLIGSSLAGLLFWRSQQLQNNLAAVPELSDSQPTTCIPTFLDGGGPYYQPNTPFREKISPDEHEGEQLIVTGKLLRSDCVTPVSGAVIDLWQANESGSYEDEWYRGQITTADDGSYRFESVVPKGYGEGTGYRPPHIHFKVFQNGREVITSQMFLPAAREQMIEPAYIVSLETKESENRSHQAYHDIILPSHAL